MYNTWRMNCYLNPRINERYRSVMGKNTNLGKSVIDLALKAYLAENPSAESIPSAFKEAAISQIKLFIFAGHDTTSSAAIFTFDLLSKHPDVLSRIRAEHTAVFGPDPSRTASLLTTSPHLLNQLPYTLAAIKEALRLYPTGAALRLGRPNFTLTSPSGQRFPTEDCVVLGDHYGVQHNPSIWPQASAFLPERWLVLEGDLLYPAKNAWRPFERGPRQCIGIELALTEIKIVLALTLRRFEVEDAYEEFDGKMGYKGKREVDGPRTYMVRGNGPGHPADGYPCRVRLLDREGDGGGI
jgi:cytochrome P450